MKKILKNDYILLIFRLILGVIFLFSAIGKIANPAEFAESILNYRLLPDILLNITAMTLPWIELICGAFLIFGFCVKESSAILLLLLIVFTTSVFIAVLRGLDIECGCFGTLMAESVGFRKISENLVFILFSIALSLYGGGKFSLNSTVNKVD